VATNPLFGKLLKQLRRESGLTQIALAKAAGVGVATIRHCEYGLREPTYGTLLKLAKGLGVSLAAFDEEPKATRPVKEKEPKKRKGGDNG
jgi:transcriptional regulator with XRE-family HTH domain